MLLLLHLKNNFPDILYVIEENVLDFIKKLLFYVLGFLEIDPVEDVEPGVSHQVGLRVVGNVVVEVQNEGKHEDGLVHYLLLAQHEVDHFVELLVLHQILRLAFLVENCDSLLQPPLKFFH